MDPGASVTPGNGSSAPPIRRRGFKARLGHFRARLVAPESPLLVYLGILLVIGGFGMIAYTWGKVAGVLAVAIQMTYLVSGAFAGLGIVAVGIALMNFGAKRRDAAAREQRVRKLSSTLEALTAALTNGSGNEDDRQQGSP